MICNRCGNDTWRYKGKKYNKNSVKYDYKCKTCSKRILVNDTIDKQSILDKYKAKGVDFTDLSNTLDNILDIRKKPEPIDEKDWDILPENDTEILAENVRLAKQKQKLQDLNRIQNKSFREHARIENALVELNTELINILKEHGDKISTKYHVVEDVNQEHIGVVHLSDLHFNELVDLPNNKYDFGIASKRLKLFANKIKKICKSYDIKKLHICFTGDLVNSNRRIEELLSMATNRTKAVLLSSHLLKEFILDLNTIANISVSSVCGNESRVDLDVGFDSHVASENYDYMIHQILKYLLESKGITFYESEPQECLININGQNLLSVHGHSKTYQGDIEKSVMQLKGKWANKGYTIDYVIFGHVHSARIGDQYSRSSSLVGANAYSEYSLNLSSRSSQNLYIFGKGYIDGVKLDLQNTENITGYPIIEQLEAYNAKSLSKTRENTTIFKIVI